MIAKKLLGPAAVVSLGLLGLALLYYGARGTSRPPVLPEPSASSKAQSEESLTVAPGRNYTNEELHARLEREMKELGIMPIKAGDARGLEAGKNRKERRAAAKARLESLRERVSQLQQSMAPQEKKSVPVSGRTSILLRQDDAPSGAAVENQRTP